MAKDVLALIVDVVADVGHEIATALGDPDGREALMGQAGRPTPAGAPPPSQQAAGVLQTLHETAHAGAESGDTDTLQLLANLTEAMAVLVSYIEQAANLQSEDDAWNLLATWLDAVAIRRTKEKDPTILALFGALHLISENRLLIADLLRARDQWGSFVLGHPADDDAKADSLSIIFGAGLAALGAVVPFENDKHERWVPDMLFGWDPEPAPPHPHATHALQRMATVSLTHHDLDGSAEEHVGLSAVVVPPGDGGWGVFVALDVGGGLTFPIGKHLELVFEADLPDAFEVFTGSDIVPGFSNISATGAQAKVSLRRKAEVADHWTIGADKSIHLEIATFLFGVELGDPSRLRLAIGGGALVLPQDTFGFLKSIVPSDGAKFTFDVDLQLDSHGKPTFAGGAGLTVTVPVNKSLSVLTVRSVTVAFAFEDTAKGEGVSLAATVAFSVAFGSAFKVVVDQIGVKLVWVSPSSPADGNGGAPVHGNLATFGDVALDFVAPRGIGVSIDIGPVKGGGFLFFDPQHRTYGGVLEASLALCKKGIQIKAAGLLRETDDGWSFVVIVSGQFEPGIEIFLGLTLDGVGGMVGINVSVDVGKLQAGLHDGAIGRLLFPEDPVANAPAIIETMTAVFPPRPGGWVAGPMLQLGWGRPNSYVKLSVAVVLAFPSPALLAILGRFQLIVPDPDFGIVDIKADFLGLISFEEPSVSFDASLVDSKLAAFALTGDMAMRANSEGFILSIGGFNPHFTPPQSVPKLRRLAIDISANPITKIRAEAYVAVTSNTFQVGVHASLDIDAGPASIHGWLDFDALVQWEPKFHFSIHIDIGLELRWEGQSIAGVDVDLLLEGPGPWHAKGRASLHFLFFTVHAGFEVTWGEVEAGDTPPEIDASIQVALSLGEEGAWSAVAPDGDALVTFRTVSRKDIGVHPYGQLSVRQQAVPIGVPVTRIGRSHVKGGTATVTLAPITGAPESSPTTGKFAIAQFQDLSDDQKLSRPSFEPFQDGIAFGASGVVLSQEKTSTATYETVFIPELQRRTDTLHGLLMLHALEVGAIARSGLHTATLYDGPDQRVRVTDTTYRVASSETLATSTAAQGTFGSATAAYAAAAAADGRVVVVEAHEVTA
ncbi:MAG: DUF6603 domain-containing protein [Gaiellaceae bacterium]